MVKTGKKAKAKYKSLGEIAKAHGVSVQAVSKWRKHAQWPRTLERAAVDRFVADWIAPHRNSSGLAAQETGRIQEPASVARTLEEIERAIRSATSPAVAELLATQARALKSLQDVQIKQRQLLPRAEVERGRVERILAVKSRLLNMPRQVAASLVGLEAPEIEAVLYGEMVKICGEYAKEAGQGAAG